MTFIFCVDYISTRRNLTYVLDLFKKFSVFALEKGKEARRINTA